MSGVVFTVSFKWEDVVGDEPVGPVIVHDTATGATTDLGWKPRAEALEIARSHGVELQESGPIDVSAPWLSLKEGLALCLLGAEEKKVFARDAEHWAARYVQETGESDETANAVGDLLIRIGNGDASAGEELALLFEGAGQAELAETARIGGRIATFEDD